ncbi:hypothetical protein PFMALIP_05933, partial [Plasmodium falciparum MaliPS096_E11]
RRKLYLHKIEGITTTESLRKWFIETAAIETFFAWHKYKVDKEIEEKEKQAAQGKVHELKDDNEEAQKQLNDGTIPEDFKRQMFYTLGDYRDILFSGSNDSKNSVKDIFSGDKEMVEREKKIKDAINNYFNSGKGQDSEKKSPDGQTPDKWWDQNAKYIWQGMICALSYDTKTQEKDEELHKTLTKMEAKNNYQSVTFEGGFHGDKTAKNATTTTKLDDFASRPQYFRWLEEWAHEFCRKRIHKLDIIKKDCMDDTGGKKCSGDGLNCDEPVPKKEDIFKPFLCPTCAKHCRKYKKWIEKKKEEFTEQEKAYDGQQKRDAESNTGATNNKEFLEKLKQYESIHLFLDSLKNGPCKNDNGSSTVDFNKEDETFGHENYCDPCPKFKVECNGGFCTGGGTQVKCNVKNNGSAYITASDIENGGDSTEINMLVSDDSTKKFEGDLNEACKRANIFEGIKENKWECRKVCGVDICTLEKKDTNGQVKEHIIMKEFVKRWLEYFFEDYNRIRKKLKPCTNSGKGSKCIKECVDTWITEKRKEWKNINSTYLKKYTKLNHDGNNLINFLETLIPGNDVKKATGHKKIRDFESKVCNCPETSKQKDEKKDIIDCLLHRLRKKAESYPTQTSVENQAQTCENSTPLEDDDEHFLEEEDQTPDEAKNMIPKICGEMTTTEEQTNTQETCTPTVDPSGPKKAEEEEEKEEDGASPGSSGGEDTAPPGAPSREKDQGDQVPDTESETKANEEVLPATAPADQPLDPTILQTTIPFGVALALGSIAFLFLK